MSYYKQKQCTVLNVYTVQTQFIFGSLCLLCEEQKWKDVTEKQTNKQKEEEKNQYKETQRFKSHFHEQRDLVSTFRIDLDRAPDASQYIHIHTIHEHSLSIRNCLFFAPTQHQNEMNNFMFSICAHVHTIEMSVLS